MKKTTVTYLKVGDSTHYTHTLLGDHYGKDYAQLAMLRQHIGCSKVLRVEYGFTRAS